jgi:hypothetical protein
MLRCAKMRRIALGRHFVAHRRLAAKFAIYSTA